MDREKEIRNITLWGAFVNVVLTVFKILAGVLGRSSAMIADGVHSLSDLLSDVVVLVLPVFHQRVRIVTILSAMENSKRWRH